eukprot:9890787-Lingulodinium_polyedra.AAC.1
MMRSNRSFAGAAARTSHASRAAREHQKLAFAWCVRGVRSRAVAAADGRFDRIIVHGLNTMRNDA